MARKNEKWIEVAAAESGVEIIPNGAGAAVILAAGIGSAVLGILALTSDTSETIGTVFNFYNPGVTTLTIVMWLGSCYVLNLRWRSKAVDMTKVNLAAFIGLAIGLLLPFLPFMDLLQGK